MDTGDIDDAVSLLQRANVLDACDDDPVSRSRIADRAGCSRATAYRATNELQERGLLERTAEGYRTTGVGSAMVHQVRRFREGLDGAEQIAPLLRYVDAPLLVQNTNRLRDATVVESTAAKPYAVEQHIESVIAGTDREIVGATVSFGSPRTLELTYEQVCDGVVFEWTFPSRVLDRLQRQHTAVAGDVMDHENTAFYAADEVTLDLAIYDETLVLLGFDDERGVVAAVATTDAPDAVDWGRQVLDGYRTAADRIA
ncbi:helix-turn-helix transcriptional regulator [Haloarchaeobius sp. DT45]|uniref:helix-turn-helix transcriptional regulator n=1 Tax=Haloarchaeobius sp. DT45 TaxID=3446116 RepID=UPI003F6D1679